MIKVTYSEGREWGLKRTLPLTRFKPKQGRPALKASAGQTTALVPFFREFTETWQPDWFKRAQRHDVEQVKAGCASLWACYCFEMACTNASFCETHTSALCWVAVSPCVPAEPALRLPRVSPFHLFSLPHQQGIPQNLLLCNTSSGLVCSLQV